MCNLPNPGKYLSLTQTGWVVDILYESLVICVSSTFFYGFFSFLLNNINRYSVYVCSHNYLNVINTLEPPTLCIQYYVCDEDTKEDDILVISSENYLKNAQAFFG